MDREKTANIVREAAQLIDRLSVSGSDKHTAIAVIQALNQVVGDLIKKDEEPETKNKKADA